MTYLKPLFLAVAVVASLFSISCKDTNKKHDLSPASEKKKIEITEEDIQEIEAFAAELTRTIDEGDRSFLDSRFNINKLSNLALKGLDLSAKEKRQASFGMKKSMPKAKQQLVDRIVSSQVKYIKFIHETRPAILYRLIMQDNTFTYCEFILDNNTANSEWQIIDLFMYSNGKRTSGVMRDTMAQMITNPNKTDSTMMKAMDKLQSVIKLNQSGKYQQAWEEWNQIDPKAHKNRVILLHGYAAALQIYCSEQENTSAITDPLLKVVSIMEKKFPNDAGLAILQLSVHEINEDAKKYREAVQKIRDKVGNDPFLDFVEASADVIEGNKDLSLKKAIAFNNIEPDTMIAYPYIWGALIEKKDYKQLSTFLDAFISHFESDSTLFVDDPDFKPFFDSPEGKAWLERQNM